MFKLLQCRVLLSALQLPLQLAYPVACLDSILQAKHTLGRVGELKWAFLCIPFTLETGSPSLLFITTNSYLSFVAWCCSSFLQLSPSKTSCPALCLATCWLFVVFFFPLYTVQTLMPIFSRHGSSPFHLLSSLLLAWYLLLLSLRSIIQINFFSAHQQWSNLRMKDQLSILLLHVPESLLIPGLRLLPCSTTNFQPSEILLL